jgi:hypothetical protein
MGGLTKKEIKVIIKILRAAGYTSNIFTAKLKLQAKLPLDYFEKIAISECIPE